jgi:branched-chain amino acid transport system substrate-binding protein
MSKNKTFQNAIKTPRSSAAGISRRHFALAGGALGGLALTGTSRTAYGQTSAAAGQTLKIGFISPRSGALAGFGEADPFVLDLVRKKYAQGIAIGGATYAVEIIDRDTQSDPARASQLAKELINTGNIDIMLATSTPEVVNPVADACEASGVPCLSTVVPWEAWYFGRGAKPGAPSPFKWTYHFSFGVADFAKAYISEWSKGAVKTNGKLAVMAPNDADGQAVRAHLYPILASAGFTVVDPGPYEDGTTDFSDQIAQFKSAGCEIFNGFPIPPDFVAFMRQAAQQGLARQLKITEIAKTGLFPSQIEALGSLGHNIAAGAYWHAAYPYQSPITGMNGKALSSAYENATTKQWQQQLGASMSLLDAGFAALSQSAKPKSKADVAAALAKLNVITTVGKVDFTAGPVPNVSTTPIVGCQWLKAGSGPYKLDFVVVDNAGDRNVPVAQPLTPYGFG